MNRSRLTGPALALVVLCVAVIALTACRSDPAPQQTGGPGAQQTHQAPSAVAGQIQHGSTVYQQICIGCHGASGEGSAAAPALIGPAALPAMPPAGRTMRTGAFNSAKDVGMFVMQNMPPGGPATPPPDVAAVLAYLLQANGVPPSQPVSPDSAGSMRLR